MYHLRHLTFFAVASLYTTVHSILFSVQFSTDEWDGSISYHYSTTADGAKRTCAAD